MNNEIYLHQQRIKDQIAKSLGQDIESNDNLEKGGEGSRGGKVIGHTQSGKPIYEHSQHTSKDFTHEDHSDAISAHMKAAKEYQQKYDKAPNTEINDDSSVQKKYLDKKQHHSSMAELHSNAMNQKLDDKVEKSHCHIQQDLIKSRIGSSFKPETVFEDPTFVVAKEVFENKPYVSEELDTIQVNLHTQSELASKLRETYK